MFNQKTFIQTTIFTFDILYFEIKTAQKCAFQPQYQKYSLTSNLGQPWQKIRSSSNLMNNTH